LSHSAYYEFCFEVVVAAEGFVNLCGYISSWSATTGSAKAIPEEAVVVVLAYIIE